MRGQMLTWALVALVVVFLAGCSDGGGGEPVQAQLAAALRGEQVQPPVLTDGQGSAIINLVSAGTAIDATMTTIGLTGVQEVLIVEGRPGVNGQTLFRLWNVATNGAWPGTITRRLLEADTITGTFAQAVSALLEGRAYALVTSVASPNGALRGQIGPVQLQSTLTGANVVPPVNTVASGVAAILINAAQTSATVSLNTVGLQGVQAVEIRVAEAGQEGPVIFALAGTEFSGTLARTITVSNLVPQPEQDILTFADATSAIIARRTYITVRTTGRPGGEVRGQILPTAL